MQGISLGYGLVYFCSNLSLDCHWFSSVSSVKPHWALVLGMVRVMGSTSRSMVRTKSSIRLSRSTYISVRCSRVMGHVGVWSLISSAFINVSSMEVHLQLALVVVRAMYGLVYGLYLSYLVSFYLGSFTSYLCFYTIFMNLFLNGHLYLICAH